ncbi:hypothetical protein K449DRAFT_208510 [Hypoxylon sp. EC38]|nr:hypothetical protein K449DRAFT_208510 [Hypoxylon sp. EC38]
MRRNADGLIGGILYVELRLFSTFYAGLLDRILEDLCRMYRRVLALAGQSRDRRVRQEVGYINPITNRSETTQHLNKAAVPGWVSIRLWAETTGGVEQVRTSQWGDSHSSDADALLFYILFAGDIIDIIIFGWNI